MNIASFLAKSGVTWASRPAIAYGTETMMNYAQFGESVRRLAGAMTFSLGLEPGDRVGIAMKNCTDYNIILFATWHAGLTAVPMNAKLHPREFMFLTQGTILEVWLQSSAW